MQTYGIFCCSEKKKLIIEESYYVSHRKLGINCSGCHCLAALGHLVSKHFIAKAFEFFSVFLCCSPRGSALVTATDRTSGQQWAEVEEPQLCVMG